MLWSILKGSRHSGDGQKACVWTKPAFLHPHHLSGKEMAQIQPPALTLDPKLIKFYAKVLHLCTEPFGHLRCAIQERGINPPYWVGLG